MRNVFCVVFGSVLVFVGARAEAELCYEVTFSNSCWESSEPPPNSRQCSGTCNAQKKCSPERNYIWHTSNEDKEWDDTEAVEEGGYPKLDATIIVCWSQNDCKCENGSVGDDCVRGEEIVAADVNIDRTLAESPGECAPE
jgi:hypothetical protein